MKNLNDALQQGAVRITYTKKDGSTRVANATLNFATIYASGKYTRSEEDLQRELANHKINGYFDLDKGEWRVYNLCDVAIAE